MLMHLREGTLDHILFLVDSVWEKRDLYIRWPREQLLLLPGVTRPTRKSESQFHVYPPDVLDRLRQAGVTADPRSNGPAVAAYCLAGGDRPLRIAGRGRRGWSAHHIYDGRHPLRPGLATTHAVKMGKLFTEAAGLVAAHPIADALADEVPYFAWLLRQEAFRRFKLDPDGVFAAKPQP